MVRKWPGLWALSLSDMEAIAHFCESEQPSSARIFFRISSLSVPGINALKGHEASLFEAIAAFRSNPGGGRKRLREGDEEDNNKETCNSARATHLSVPRLPAWASSNSSERTTVAVAGVTPSNSKFTTPRVPAWMTASPISPSGPPPKQIFPNEPPPEPVQTTTYPLSREQSAEPNMELNTEREAEYPFFPDEVGEFNERFDEEKVQIHGGTKVTEQHPREVGVDEEARARFAAGSATEGSTLISHDPCNKELVLTKEQEQVLSLCLSGRSVCVLGYAGTGKSLLLRRVVKEFASRGIKYAVTASTGIAAVSIEGRTIHSWSGLALFEDKPINKMVLAMGAVALENVRTTDVLLLDEISMVSPFMIDTMDNVFRLVRSNHTTVFGGLRVIFFGDFAQLPPIESGKGRGEYAFESKAWDLLFPLPDQIVQLTRVMRQSSSTPEDMAFLRSLEEMRAGMLSSESLTFLNSLRRPVSGGDGIVPTTLYSTNHEVDADNQRELEKLPGQAITFVATETGPRAGREILQKNCRAPLELVLKVGAQVVLLKNLDVENGLANGSRGVVVGFIEPGFVGPVIRFVSGLTISFAQQTPFSVSVPNGKATRLQFPLRLAWAITTHKSQGMTLDRVKVNLERAFAPGQAYVAFSRVRSPDGLELSGSLNASMVTSHPKIAKFLADLEKRRKERDTEVNGEAV